jgi:hypothetical protein
MLQLFYPWWKSCSIHWISALVWHQCALVRNWTSFSVIYHHTLDLQKAVLGSKYLVVMLKMHAEICSFTQQERPRTCNVMLRRIHETIVAMENNKYYIFVYVYMRMCSHVALLVQHTTCPDTVCGLWLHHIFLTLPHKQHDFQEKGTEHKICILIFLYNFHLTHFSFYEEFSKLLS